MTNERISITVLREFLGMMTLFADVLGFKLDIDVADQSLTDEEIEDLIEERIQARNTRDFARSDAIRDMLKEKQIILEDTAQGTRWKRG